VAVVMALALALALVLAVAVAVVRAQVVMVARVRGVETICVCTAIADVRLRPWTGLTPTTVQVQGRCSLPCHKWGCPRKGLGSHRFRRP
jgi:hypothetical protein